MNKIDLVKDTIDSDDIKKLMSSLSIVSFTKSILFIK